MDAAYETFLYENLPISDTHPDWLGFLAHLAGMTPAPADRCRVLSLGCGLGGNLMAMADLHPNSEFVGVDLAQAQIEFARRDVADLGLQNLRFEAMDLSLIDSSWGRFDYIICHGVYSWVPPPVQRRILEICRDHLSPQGVALVSYNTLPGWHARGMFRQMLHRVVPSEGSPPQRAALARRFLQFLRDTAPEAGALTPWMRSDLDLILGHTDRYLFFELLAQDNHPCYLGDFVRTAQRHDLQYLGDAEPHASEPRSLGPQAPDTLAEWTTDPLQTEQLMDYASGRFFRRTLLCHAEQPLNRAPHLRRLRPAWFASRFVPNANHTPIADGVAAAFTMPDGYVISTTDAVLKATLLALHAHRPASLTSDQLLSVVAALLGTAPDEALRDRVLEHLRDLFGVGRVNAGLIAPPIARSAPNKPRAPRWAQLRARRGNGEVTNLHHETVALDKLDRVLVAAMDGTRDPQALVDAVRIAMDYGRVKISLNGAPLTDNATLLELVALKLRHLLRRALILDP